MHILNSNFIGSVILAGMTGPEPTPPAPSPPVVDFSASTTGPTAGNSVTFTDLSTNTPTAWQWQFPGGTPTGSTGQNPSITYGSTGTYNVTLTASNAGGTGTLTKTNYITVAAAPAPVIVEETFTTNGTWSCCPGALCVEVVAVGGGGGGAAGGARNNLTICNDRGIAGGAGGGGGAVVIATITGAQLTSSVSVVVGGAGSGGNGVSACTWPGRQGNIGTDGGNSCFGGFLIARGGKTPGDGGYSNPAPGGINSCSGQGGTGAILCGTGTVCNGGNGGGMNATCTTDINGLPASNVSGTTRAPGAGAGGSLWYCNSLFCGTGGAGQNANTVCSLSLGSSGNGGSPLSTAPTTSIGYGAGGAGSAASCTASCNASAGTCGVIKVIQYL